MLLKKMKCKPVVLSISALLLAVIVYLHVKRVPKLDYSSFATNGELLSGDEEVPKWAMSGATARVFSGTKTRQYTEKVLFSAYDAEGAQGDVRKLEPWCEKWGVITTIVDVTEAVQRQVQSNH